MKIISKISIIVIMFISVIGFNFKVYADEPDSSCSYYYIYSYEKQYSSSTVTEIGTMNVQYNCDIKLAYYWNLDWNSSYSALCVLVMYPDGTISDSFDNGIGVVSYDDNMKKYISSASCNYKHNEVYSSGEIDTWEMSDRSVLIKNSDKVAALPNSSTLNVTLSTNVPIFVDKSTAALYLKGSINISQAENYEDCIDISYDSTDIPIPHNLKVTEESGKYYISWSQTSEEISFITEVSYRNHIDALQITHDTEGAYPTYPKKPEKFYEPLLLHKYDITNEILNIVKFYREKCGVDSFKCSYVIRIRNKYVKSETEILYSNVVRAVLTISYDVNSGVKISAEYEEKTESGDFVPDSSYNDYGDGSGLIRDDIGASSGGSLSTGNFLSNIVNGFGLLGGSGIVSLTASALSFIPSELWTLIYFSLSLFLIIALFKLVIK